MRMHTSRFLLLAALGAGLLLSACGGGDGTPTAPAGATTVIEGGSTDGYPIDSIQGGDATAVPVPTFEGYPTAP